MSITYFELKQKIELMTSDQLSCDVTIDIEDEFFQVNHFELVDSNEDDRLDDGHPILVIL